MEDLQFGCGLGIDIYLTLLEEIAGNKHLTSVVCDHRIIWFSTSLSYNKCEKQHDIEKMAQGLEKKMIPEDLVATKGDGIRSIGGGGERVDNKKI